MTEAQIARAEWQLIELLRQGGEEFKLSISQRGGVWTIDVDQMPHSDADKFRGVGSSFSAAWSALTVDPITPAGART